MPAHLASGDFEGFDAGLAGRYLNSFAVKTRRKGENYYAQGAVDVLECETPGSSYTAVVIGGDTYHVSLWLDEESDEWLGECTCPVEIDCKHIYAAFKQLLTEHASLEVQALTQGTGRASGGKSSKSSANITLADYARAKLGRALAPDETQYLKKVRGLFQRAHNGGLHHVNDLSGLGVSASGWWEPLKIYPKVPQTEPEFWNYLALYLTEKLQRSIPQFMECVTDLESARVEMRRHFRRQDIADWSAKLAHYGVQDPSYSVREEVTVRAELRLRFKQSQAAFETREPEGEWAELKQRKMRDFDWTSADSLSLEAASLWQAYWQRAQGYSSVSLKYTDIWARDQIGRWLRQRHLRPLLAGPDGAPLVFHEQSLRWEVEQPDEDDGDYSLSLRKPDGRPVGDIWLTTTTLPVLYLTAEGVFPGPPVDEHLLSVNKQTLIPAAALESAGGLRLLSRLQAAPPPRLAGRVRTVKLLPHIVAEVKIPWKGVETEYCHVDVLGVSEDAEVVERWTGNGWSRSSKQSGRETNGLTQMDRSALGGLAAPVQHAGFGWEFHTSRWSLRINKKFAETFVTFLKALPADTRIDLRGELASFQNAEVAGRIRLEASESEMDWFDLRVLVDVTDATLTPEEIKLLLDAKGSWVRLDKKGWRKLEFTLSKEEDQELARLGLTPHGLTSEPQRLHAFQLADKAARKFLPSETCDRIERRASELQARVTPTVPEAITAEMRPYQRDGFHFLAYLSTNHFGGILADDMGLGKTLQTLAWLAWLRSDASKAGDIAPSLVVCPKSVADNWRAEAEKFLPSLKVRVWSASELKSFGGMLSSADLHVLNYSQLRQVSDDLARATFQAVILDEGQYIKNPSSQTAQVARTLRASHRLILSGTPIENQLLDLWSLMSFAMPGALGSRAEFGRLYNAKDDPFARTRLSARVRPFLIRRTKSQVARDLPDRTEEDLYCELEGEQKTLYRAELKRAQAMLLGVKTAAALNKQRFNFLTSLLRLRQICCHPALVKPDSKQPGAKLEALIETLEPLIEEGEKVIVFSQFVELLNLLRNLMKKRGWHHWYLAGDTENRGALVSEFQSSKEAGVFLISLKAGGFGLNLTAASYVVLFDPWWNPAVENQAIDRTHRIGQERKVIAYRLLIKDSIEEKIRALQRQKSALANDVLGEEKFSQSLSLDDLRYLLAN